MESRKQLKTINICFFSLVMLLTLTGCFGSTGNSHYVNKGFYDDVIPTVDNFLELAVLGKEYTIKDLNLTSDEKNAIEYYQNNEIKFIDLKEDNPEEYIIQDNSINSISNYAYDIKLIEKYFGLKIDTIIVDSTAEAISMINSGEADIITQIIYSDSRSDYITFVDEPSVNRPVYYYTKEVNDDNRFVALLELPEEERKVGVINNTYQFASEFIENYGLQATMFNTIDDAIIAIENGEIEGFISNVISMDYYGNYGIKNINRYLNDKLYSIAYNSDKANLKHLATAIQKLLDIDSRQHYDELKMKLLLSNGTYLTDEEKTAIEHYKDNPLRVEMSAISYPETYIDDNGLWAGVAVDSFEYRSEVLGVNYEIVTKPNDTFSTILTNVGAYGDTPTSDAVVGLWYTTEREKYLDYTQPILDVNFVLVGRNTTQQISDLDDISELEIGITKHYGYIDLVLNTSFASEKEYIEFDDEIDLVNAYIDGEIDFFMISEGNLDIYMSEYKLYDAVIKYDFGDKSSVSSGFVKNEYSKGLVSAYNKIAEYDEITKYTEHYDISGNLSEIIALENKIATRNIVFLGLGIIFLILMSVIVLFHRKRQESIKEARTDKLTEVGNRRAFFEDCEKLTISNYKILFIDLSNFKIANDTYGHNFGDTILKVTAKRLSTMSEKSTTYRLGGDEFVVTIPVTDKFDLDKAIKRISTPIYDNVNMNTVEKNSIMDNKQLHGYVLNFACGVIDLSKFPEFDDLDTILKYVDLAMYEAKKKGKVNSTFFEVDEKFMKSFDNLNQIEKTISAEDVQDVFSAVYQPILNIKTNKIIGYESFPRYKNNLSISPSYFLAAVKRNNKLKDLDLFILEEGVKVLSEFISNGVLPKNAKTTASLSPRTVAEINVKELDEIVSKHKIKKDNIYLGISEESISSVDSLLNIYKLKNAGYKLSVDDFAANNGSFTLLSELNVDFVKLDKQLINAITHDFADNERHIIIYEAVVELSKKLGFRIISDGVETKNQLDILGKLDIVIAQGTFVSNPLSKKNLANIIKEKNK